MLQRNLMLHNKYSEQKIVKVRYKFDSISPFNSWISYLHFTTPNWSWAVCDRKKHFKGKSADFEVRKRENRKQKKESDVKRAILIIVSVKWSTFGVAVSSGSFMNGKWNFNLVPIFWFPSSILYVLVIVLVSYLKHILVM